MTTSYGDWQPGHLGLGAPELYVLLHGPDADASEVFKLALHELVGRGVVTLGLRQEGSGRDTTRTALILPTGQRPTDLSRGLGSVMDAVDGLAQSAGGSAEGVAVQDLARELRKRQEGDLGEWVKADVLPALVERKLYEVEDVKRLGVIPTTRREPTAEGKAAQALLEADITRVEAEFPSWAADDSSRAGTFLAAAGPGVLLMPELRPAIQRLQTASPGTHKMMDAGARNVADIKDAGFDIGRLVTAGDSLKVLDDVIDYVRLDQDRASEE